MEIKMDFDQLVESKADDYIVVDVKWNKLIADLSKVEDVIHGPLLKETEENLKTNGKFKELINGLVVLSIDDRIRIEKLFNTVVQNERLF